MMKMKVYDKHSTVKPNINQINLNPFLTGQVQFKALNG